MAEPLADDALVVRAADTIATEVGGEAVILDMAGGSYARLNPVGTRIWRLIETPLSVAALCARLEAEFAVDPALCRSEARAFLETLRARGLIDVRSSAA